MQPTTVNLYRASAVILSGLLTVTGAGAALFEDDEARQAILDLRQRVEAVRVEVDSSRKAASDDNMSLGKSLLDLQRQIELLKTELSGVRGTNEQLMRELANVQRIQKDQVQVVSERLSKFEPINVKLDGVEFVAEPAEKRDFDAALAVFRKGDFSAAQNLFAGFLNRYTSSGYTESGLFWLGNAQYATRGYKEAIVNFRALVAKNPEHMRAPEAVLSIANCQLELKDAKSARKTFSDLIKAYPQSEAAVAAKERLSTLK
ncbi:MAG: tol-pal system protein YbgF [Rhodoferax sp.]|uniref:tol-pal system protein YbgF n=1 Tax=Rhodoferax sp. TaxID=50421 RepID=UPI002613344C|nr:tol-pal system protein YbgF [Rhodoferax sp.]MDD2879269.1 tol-pal system protein YbgF [Rhodoferax sp.]